MLNYFAQLKPGKMVLWFYLIWYFVTVYFHFDPNPKIWINALGISVVIGIALLLSVGAGQSLTANLRLQTPGKPSAYSGCRLRYRVFHR